MSLDLSVVQEVVIDDSKSAVAARRVVASQEAMAAAQDKVTEASERQASGFALFDQAVARAAPAQESAIRRMNMWKAAADPVEGALQRLSRAESDWNRAIAQGHANENDKIRNLDLLWNKLLGAAQAQEQLTKAQQAAAAQTAFNAQLGVRDDFNGSARAADIAAYGQEIDRVRAKFVPLAAAQQGYISKLAEIRQSVKANALSEAEGAAAIARTKDEFAKQVKAIHEAKNATIDHTGAVKLQGYQLANVFQQLQDIGVQAQMGTNPLVILAQQGPQITTAMGGVRNAFKLVAEQITPLRLGLTGVAAAGVVLVARAFDIASEARAAGIAIRSMGKDAEISTAQFHGMVEAMRGLGVDKDEARGAVTAGVRVVGAGQDDISRASRLAPDFAAGFGVSVEQATKQLTEMGVQGYSAIMKLDEAYGFLSADQARQIRMLADQGKQAEAVALAYEAMGRRVNGAAMQAYSSVGAGWKAITNEIREGIDLIANSDVVQNTLQRIADGLFLMRTAIQGTKDNSADFLPGGARSGTPSAAPPVENTAHRKAVDELTSAYAKQDQVMQASVGTRDLVRAQIAAEAEATKLGWEGAVRSELITIRVAEAKRQMAVAANDNLEAIRKETEGQLFIASAYERGAATGKIAESMARALGDAYRNSAVDVEALTQAYRENAAAQQLVAGGRTIQDMRSQASAAEKLTIAARSGAEASQEAARQIEVETFRRQQLAAATDQTRDALLKQVAAYDEESRRRLTAQQELAREAALRKGSQEASIAAAQAQAAAIADPELRRAAELQIERQQKINDLTAQYGTIADGTGQKLLAMWDQTAASREQARFWEDVRGEAKSVANDVSGFLVDGFVNAEHGGKSMFDNMYEAGIAGGKRFLARLAAMFLEQKFIMPIAMQVVGSMPGLFGIATPGGSTSANTGGGFFSMPGGGMNFGGVGQMFGNAWSGLSNLFSGAGSAAATQAAASSYGLSAGQAAMASNAGSLGGGGIMSGLGSAFSAIPVWGWFAAAASIAKNFVGGADPRSGKGVVNTLLGPSIEEWMSNPGRSLANAANPVATALGDLTGSRTLATVLNPLTLLSGLFGPKKSVGPIGHTNIYDDGSGRLVVGSTGADNGADPQATISQANSLVESVNKLLDAYDLKIAPSTHVSVSQGANATGLKSAEDVFKYLLNDNRFRSEDPVLQQIIKASQGSGPETFESNLQFGAIYKQTVELQEVTTELAKTYKSLSDAYDANIEKVKQLGLSVSAFTEGTASNFDAAVQRTIKEIVDPVGLALDDYAKTADARLDYARKIGADMVEVERLNALERQKIIQQGGADLKAWLQGELLGPTSSLTGAGKFTEAQSQFQEAIGAARSGNGSIAEVTRLADILLGFNQEYQGGTKAGAVFEEMIRSSIRGIGKELGFPGFADGTTSAPPGMAWVGERGPELVNFRGGEQVYTAIQSSLIAANSNGATSRDIGEVAYWQVRSVQEATALRAEVARLATTIERMMSSLMLLQAERNLQSNSQRTAA